MAEDFIRGSPIPTFPKREGHQHTIQIIDNFNFILLFIMKEFILKRMLQSFALC